MQLKRKFNLRSYWREVLIAVMAAFLIWMSLDKKSPNVIHTGSSYTECIVERDTIHLTTMGRTVDTRYVTMPIYVRDTLIEHDTIQRIYVDTMYEVIEMPLTEYIDTSQYYIRTIGWLDSIAIYPKVITHYKTIKERQKFALFGNSTIGQNQFSPGAAAMVNRFYFGYNYNVIDKAGAVTVGYRIY